VRWWSLLDRFSEQNLFDLSWKFSVMVVERVATIIDRRKNDAVCQNDVQIPAPSLPRAACAELEAFREAGSGIWFHLSDVSPPKNRRFYP
jgi:hypothetical protein